MDAGSMAADSTFPGGVQSKSASQVLLELEEAGIGQVRSRNMLLGWGGGNLGGRCVQGGLSRIIQAQLSMRRWHAHVTGVGTLPQANVLKTSSSFPSLCNRG